MSYCFLSVGTVGAVRCVRTINSVKVFVEAYVTCNDAYTCAIPCAIVEVVSKNFESLLVVIAKNKISMCVSVSVPSFMSKAVNFVVNHVFDVVEWDKAAYQVAAHRSSFGELVCLFIAPVSCVSFYPFKINCVFVCKFGESFMAVIDGLVVVYFIGESLKCR